jgi:lipoprotein-releasing system ATP-binding protein
MNKPLLEAKHLSKIYGKNKKTVVLEDLDIALYPGEIVGLVAPSGTGKSTLLHQIGLLEHPTSGSISLLGNEVSKASDAERTALRLNHLGFVYQFHHLLPEFSALENIMMPLLINNQSQMEAKKLAINALKRFSMDHLQDNRPSELSGGEQQRVAVLRALINNPSIILADEPTGNLDEATSNIVFDEFIRMVKEQKATALIATHNLSLTQKMDRVITIRERKIQPWKG